MKKVYDGNMTPEPLGDDVLASFIIEIQAGQVPALCLSISGLRRGTHLFLGGSGSGHPGSGDARE